MGWFSDPLKEAAGALGLEIVRTPGSLPIASGTYGPARLEVWRTAGGLVLESFCGSPSSVCVTRVPGDPLARATIHHAPLGDRDFDDRAWVFGEELEVAAALSCVDRRGLVDLLFRQSGRIDFGRVIVRINREQLGSVREIAERVAGIAASVSLGRGVVQRLVDGGLQETSLEFRIRILVILLTMVAAERLRDLWSALLRDQEPAIRLLAHSRLSGSLDTRDSAEPAQSMERFLAANRFVSDEFARMLIDMVSRFQLEPRIREAVWTHALGSTTVRLIVEALEWLAGNGSKDVLPEVLRRGQSPSREVRDAADEAVRSIQSRITGASTGQLSISGPTESGNLSHAAGGEITLKKP